MLPFEYLGGVEAAPAIRIFTILSQASFNLPTYRVIVEHELDGLQTHQLPQTAVSNAQITQQL